ncbi:MAG: HAMP domain-containing histidine kinase [Bacteroidetes bacterium]|nr:HAMP domain-containing histidine kinase [Bacteroidota bacterium]
MRKLFYQNKFFITFIALLFITATGLVEWISGYELSFGFLYLMVLCFFALNKYITHTQIVIHAIYATLVGLFVQLKSEAVFSSGFIPYANALINFLVAMFVSFLCYSFSQKQKALLNLNEHLNKMNHEKNMIIGITAHDLRSPFASIQSISEILMPEEKNTENLKFLEMIHQTSKNSLTLVDNLLSVSMIESGFLQLNIQSSDYFEFIKNVIEFHQVIAGTKNIKIVFECSDDKLILEFDKVHIEQVIRNLLLNAIKYSKQDSEVKVSVSIMNEAVLTQIIDCGVGIPEKEIVMLFNFFQKTSARPTSGEKGHGLGLAICKRIIAAHNGVIGVKSKVNEGSEFYFTLPLKNKLPAINTENNTGDDF